MVQWGVLKDTAQRGVYECGGARVETAGPLALVLLEALLLGTGSEAMAFDQAVRHPALFPFRLNLTTHDLRGAPQFRLYRQGLYVDVVRLAEGPNR